jgi:hypothetical protein
VNLNNRIGRDFGDMNVGDEKDFSLTVKIVTGYRHAEDSAEK